MNWAEVEIGDVADVLPGFAFKSAHLGDEGTPVVKIGNITDGGEVTFADAQKLPDSRLEPKHERFRLANRDILLAMTGATAGKAGRISAPVSATFLLNQRVAKIEPKSIDPDFFWYVISTKAYRERFFSLGGGAAQPNMSGPQIAAIKIPFPPLVVQKKIAVVLSAYDDLVENNRRQIGLLEEAARLLYREWFIHFRFPGHEYVKIIDGLPQGWARKELGKLAKISKGRNITKNSVEDGNVPVVAGGLKPAYYHNVANAKAPVVTVSASGANAGYVALYLKDIWASDCSYMTIDENPHIWFWYLTFKCRQAEITSMQQGAAQPHVYPSHLRRMQIVMPPPELLEEFQEIVGRFFALVSNLQVQVDRLASARDLLLPRLMNGEIAV